MCLRRNLNCFAPNINLIRDPRWGRSSETYGEDPHLTGALSAAYVQGMQGSDPIYTKACTVSIFCAGLKSIQVVVFQQKDARAIFHVGGSSSNLHVSARQSGARGIYAFISIAGRAPSV